MLARSADVPDILPEGPRVRSSRSHKGGAAPARAAIKAHLDRCDGLFSRPSQPEDTLEPQAQDVAVAGTQDFRFDFHRSDRFGPDAASSAAAHRVFHALEMTLEGSVDDFDARQPLDRSDPKPPGDDQTSRKPMIAVKRFSIHPQGHERLGMERLLEGEAAREDDLLGMARFFAAVRSLSH